MKIHKGYEGLSPVNPVVTLGIFDGVHRGHMALIESVRKRAAEIGGESMVMTFNPHPRHVLGSGVNEPALLTTLDEKACLLENAGVDHLIILDFSMEFSNMDACDFVREILVKRIGARYLIMGYDHRFGRRGEGDIDKIRQCKGLGGLLIEQEPGIILSGEPVSSSGIRAALAAGKPEEANELLGYRYTLGGRVIEGEHIGRSFGFPTANIKPGNKEKLIPASGVYAVDVLFENDLYAGMLSIGSNPTVNPDAGKRSIEVHIIDFNREIYGKSLTVRFVKRLRDEKKFPDIAHLARQMELDKQETIRLLK